MAACILVTAVRRFFLFVFVYSLSTEGDDLRDQESVSRVLAELLDNQEGLFDSDDEDISSTNDYSSLNEPVRGFAYTHWLCNSICVVFHRFFCKLCQVFG